MRRKAVTKISPGLAMTMHVRSRDYKPEGGFVKRYAMVSV